VRFHFISTRLSQGVHHLLSTRNNNFSNRSQKATIVVLAAALLAATRSSGGLSQQAAVAVSVQPCSQLAAACMRVALCAPSVFLL
jgi:hypothetical protein